MAPRPGPRMEPYTFRLTDEHAAWLATEAERRGVSQSELLRELLDNARQGELKL